MNTKQPFSKRCVIYCRVSTKEQVEEGGSLGTQEKICTEYALKHGYDIGRVFIEKGESAKNADRTQLKELLAYCTTKKNSIKSVVIYKIDRLARNTDDYRQIRFVLKRHGVEIKSTSEFFEDNPAGRFQESILSSVAQFDNDVRTERSVNGMRDAMRDGRFVWKAPIGFDNGIVNGKPNIVPNQMASLVLMAFEEVAIGIIPSLEIYRKSTKAGLLARNGKAISQSHFYRMLSNELYMGWINGLGERNNGVFTPIVSEELFANLQLALNKKMGRSIQYKKDTIDFPLRRFFYHPIGRKLTGAWSQGRSKKYPYYRYHIAGHVYRKENIETIFKRYLEDFKLTNQQFKKLKEKICAVLESSVLDTQKDADRVSKNIQLLKEKQNTLIEKNISGVISDHILKEQLEYIRSEIEIASASLVPPVDISKAEFERAISEAAEYLKSPSIAWEKAPLSAKLKLQWFNFPKGIIFNGENCRTTEIASVYTYFRDNLPFNSSLVTPPGIEPGLTA